MERICVLVHSKYSPKCVKLLEALASSPINLRTTIGLTTMCIDNEAVRKRISASDTLRILTVPTLLIVYKDGGVEKYEGNRLIEWIDETVRTVMTSLQPIHQVLPPQYLPEDTHYDDETENAPESREEYEKAPIQQNRQPKKAQPVKQVKSQTVNRPKKASVKAPVKPTPKPPKKQASIKQTVNIDDLEEVEEEDETENEPIEDIPVEKEKNAAVIKANNLMAAAMAMQKEREPLESTRNNKK